MKTIKLTHANTRQIVYTTAALIFCYYYSDAHKAVLVMATGGAMLPVVESVDQIEAALREV